MNTIPIEKFMIREVFNKKYKGSWKEQTRICTVTVGVLTRYSLENEKAIKAGGIDVVIGITPEYRFLPMCKIGNTSEGFWTSSKYYDRYAQANSWIDKQLEQYREE